MSELYMRSVTPVKTWVQLNTDVESLSADTVEINLMTRAGGK